MACLCVRLFFPSENFLFYHQKSSYFYEILSQNSFVNRNSKIEPLEYLFYSLVPEGWEVYIVAIFDGLVSYFLHDYTYFIFSSFIPSQVSSLENLIIVISLLTKNVYPIWCLSPYFLCLQGVSFYNAIDKYYLIAESNDLFAKTKHLPNTNNFWFYYMYIFEQYRPLFSHLINISSIFLSSLAKNDTITKLIIMFIFKKSSYKNFIFLHCLYKKKQKCKQKNLEIFYFLLMTIEFYVTYLFKHKGSGNLNFINWSQFLFFCLLIINQKVF